MRRCWGSLVYSSKHSSFVHFILQKFLFLFNLVMFLKITVPDFATEWGSNESCEQSEGWIWICRDNELGFGFTFLFLLHLFCRSTLTLAHNNRDDSHSHSTKDSLRNSHILSSPHVLSIVKPWKWCFADLIPIRTSRWTEIGERTRSVTAWDLDRARARFRTW